MSQVAQFEVSLKLIIKNSTEEILGLKVPPAESYMFGYDLPGGRIDEDEVKKTYEDNLRREVREELGEAIKLKIDLHPVAVSTRVYFSERRQLERKFLQVFFAAEYVSGEIKLSSEHADYDWLQITPQNVREHFSESFAQGIEAYLFFRRRSFLI